MGAPAISTPARRPRTKPRPATKPRSGAKARTAPKARTTAPRTRTTPKARTAPKPRSTAQARSAARSAGARPASRTAASPAGIVMFPVAAVGRTAVAVGGIADCGVVVGMTRSRVWIGVLGLLLGGIVALNVWGLSLSAASSATAAKIDALERDNSVQRARIANRLSIDKIAAAAARLGLAVPPPDGVHYLSANNGDAAKAAKRLAEGAIGLLAPVVDPGTADPATIDPAATTDPASIGPAAADPAAVATAPVDPAIAAVDPAAVDPAATTTDPAAVAPVATDPVTGGVSVP